MTKQQWKEFDPLFKPTEKWGNPYQMHYVLLWMLHRLRTRVDKPFIIHCGYEKEGHAPNSLHKIGQAVDFHVKGREEIEVPTNYGYENMLTRWVGINYTFLDEIVNTFRVGIGIYPYWNNPGFHIDLGPRRIWWQDREGKYNYFQ